MQKAVLETVELFTTQKPVLGLCDLPTIQLSNEFMVFHADLRFIPSAAQIFLRLVNAADCRRSVRFEVQMGAWVSWQSGQIMAAWESFLFELPANTPRMIVELKIRVLDQPSLLESSLRPTDSLPALVMYSNQLAPRSSIFWITNAPSARALVFDFLYSSAAFDYLGWMVGCTTTALSM